jgi:O-antigen/teichoic acid export membrane protein
MLTGFALVPILLSRLDAAQYGIWLTLTSVVAWFGFFDVGLGHGLRNRFAESMARSDDRLARRYVSTTYALVGAVTVIIVAVVFGLSPLVPWDRLLNAPPDAVPASELRLLVLVVVALFGATFVLQLLTTVLTADQKPAAAAFVDLAGKVLSLLFVVVAADTSRASLLLVGIALMTGPCVAMALASLFFYTGRYRAFRPAVQEVDLSLVRDLATLGIKFFVIRVSALVLYSTNNVIIAQLFGPEHVTPYSIAVSYFSVLLVLFNVGVSPFWSAFTEAWTRKDTAWIRDVMRKLVLFWAGLTVLGSVMVAASGPVITLWVGAEIRVPTTLAALVCGWTLCTIWNGVFSQFLYGVGAVTLQAYVAALVAVVNVPLCILFGGLWGIHGVVAANLALAAVQMVVYPVQYAGVMRGRTEALWAR